MSKQKKKIRKKILDELAEDVKFQAELSVEHGRSVQTIKRWLSGGKGCKALYVPSSLKIIRRHVGKSDIEIFEKN